MSLYRSLLAVVAALVIAIPAFAADEATSAQTTEQTAASTQQMSKVDINKATVKDLTKIKGITAARAKAIVAYRKKNGDFKSTDDLKNVKGFNKLKDNQLKEIQDQLTAG